LNSSEFPRFLVLDIPYHTALKPKTKMQCLPATFDLLNKLDIKRDLKCLLSVVLIILEEIIPRNGLQWF